MLISRLLQFNYLAQTKKQHNKGKFSLAFTPQDVYTYTYRGYICTYISRYIKAIQIVTA